ncbi:leukocyte elastase inhibitor [Protopterus annectens]|uniref:leukocyte elastase inhibitor n=1 Tax=Protopterus annectens TaxID=7888 RepID=UPI001CFC0E09|nr:leukocyte elastase inhibitor [Protopterus annectens]XP_043921102.1 leukocyte elastase inhibitor [Protopterus annectens]
MDKLGDAVTCFALDLFKKISETNAVGNVFYSPMSICSALAMVFVGARGSTESQMKKTLHFNKVDDIHSQFQTLNAAINKPDASFILRLANRLYGEKAFNFLPQFLESTAKFYQATLSPVDFIGAFEEAREQINKWVEGQTEGKIQDLLASGTVNSLTRLVLVNAIYFKGSWAEKFDEGATQDMKFRLNKNETKPVKMMYQKKKFPFRYIPEMNLRVLELPYKGKDLSMIVLLPDDISDDSTGLKQLEKELSMEKIKEWTSPEYMGHIDVHVHLPKFKLEDKYDLESTLAEMGMSDLFDGSKADLSGITGKTDLHISKVAHKSFIEVNEEGTEAAAATAGIAMFCMFLEENFTADHPFLFFIRHNQTNSILFFGRFSSP